MPSSMAGTPNAKLSELRTCANTSLGTSLLLNISSRASGPWPIGGDRAGCTSIMTGGAGGGVAWGMKSEYLL